MSTYAPAGRQHFQELVANVVDTVTFPADLSSVTVTNRDPYATLWYTSDGSQPVAAVTAVPATLYSPAVVGVTGVGTPVAPGASSTASGSTIKLVSRRSAAYTLTAAGSGGGGAATVETVNTVAASGAAQTIPDVTTATLSNITLTAACTLTFPTAAAGKSFTLVLTQDATGSRLVTWPTMKWPGGVAPILSTVAGKVDVVSVMCVDGTNWMGFVAGLDVR
jgi:hypothetical protein